MRIGVVAGRIGLSVDAIRFYERNALLPRPPRTHGGFRQYGETDIETLAFIRRVQGLEFKLREIHFEAARKPLATVRAGAQSIGRKSG